MNKVKLVQADVVLVNDRVKFDGLVEGRDPISIDYIPPLGDGDGHTSLELFLLALSSCLGTVTLALLRNSKRDVKSFSIAAKGHRQTGAPFSLNSVVLDITIDVAGIEAKEFEEMIAYAEGTLCPVAALLKPDLKMTITHNL